jgi:NAD(P)-dependent dehydrogenase (short-subunit alcohol dehydrogenase family)
MATRFEGQVVWITGGGSGIGRALALAMAEEGADVAVSGRRQDKLDAVAAEIQATGRRGLGVVCDVTDEASLAAAIERVVAELGGLDVAVANAGFSVSGRVLRHTADDWRRQFETNVIGAVMTIRHAMPELTKRGGRAVLVASVASMFTYPNGGPYCASKAALRAIGQALSIELKGTGVSCTTIHPGFVESEIAQVDNLGHYDPSRPETRPGKLMWPADRAAKTMMKAIHRRKREYVFTWHGVVATWIARHLPGVAFRMAGSGTAKSNSDRLAEVRTPKP